MPPQVEMLEATKAVAEELQERSGKLEGGPMELPARRVDVYIEMGQKRAFAGAVEWPGWCRSGRDEESALQALCAYGPRYARVLDNTGLGFTAPDDVSSFTVLERLTGSTTTDFGAPDCIPAADTVTVTESDLARFEAVLEACWQAFDAATDAASGKELRKGPRGGGRDVEAIIRHVLGADAGYLGSLGGRVKLPHPADTCEELDHMRRAMLNGLEAAAHGEIPLQGPRGGTRWPPGYFVRRAAWHVLDHLWEIEDRII